MSNTLYDLLEVSQTASPSAISESYKRLYVGSAEKCANGDEDATNRLIALKEAFNTISSPEKRKAYDQKLEAKSSATEIQSPFPIFKVLLLAVVLATSAVSYSKYQAAQEQARLEREKTVAAARMAELDAQKAQQEKMAAEQAESQRRRDEAFERANREREYSYGKQVSRDIQRAETAARQEKDREKYQQEREEYQRQYDAARQLANEKATLRRLEVENSRYPRY
jgi:colicin import membrane protein